jgi:hypothetical protein
MLARTPEQLKPGDRVFIGINLGGAIADEITLNSPEGKVQISWLEPSDNQRLITQFEMSEKFFIYPPELTKEKLARHLQPGDRLDTPRGATAISKVWKNNDGTIEVRYCGIMANLLGKVKFDPAEVVELEHE